MSLVLVMIRVLMVQSKEEVILGRLAELNLSVNVFTDTQNWHKRRREGLSLSETVIHPNEGISLLVKSFPPEEIFAR